MSESQIATIRRLITEAEDFVLKTTPPSQRSAARSACAAMAVKLHALVERDLITALDVSASPSEDWQPIATAPKDGTGIIAYQNGNMRVCNWSQSGWAFYQSKPGAPIVAMMAPTHWRPLPAPPSPAIPSVHEAGTEQKA